MNNNRFKLRVWDTHQNKFLDEPALEVVGNIFYDKTFDL